MLQVYAVCVARQILNLKMMQFKMAGCESTACHHVGSEQPTYAEQNVFHPMGHRDWRVGFDQLGHGA